MSRQRTTKEIIERAQILYGDLFDYSKTVYSKSRRPLIVTCKKHGDFNIRPESLLKGRGCPSCRLEKLKEERKRKSFMPTQSHNAIRIYGVAVNDLMFARQSVLYKTWFGMLRRCYDSKWRSKHPSYRDAKVCEEWLMLSSFKEWFDKNYIDGYALDKDILVKDNKIYSPETCCFVPQKINNLILRHEHKRGTCYIGVFKTRCGNYQAYYSHDKHRVTIGTFNTEMEAFEAYKEAKESYLSEVASAYYKAGKITKRVYDALMEYKVEITD